MSFTNAANAADTVGWSVTVSGVSFGTVDATPSSRFGLSSCVTSAWVSATSVACLPNGGQGPAFGSVLTAVGVAGTRTRRFSYDGSSDA